MFGFFLSAVNHAQIIAHAGRLSNPKTVEKMDAGGGKRRKETVSPREKYKVVLRDGMKQPALKGRVQTWSRRSIPLYIN